MTVSFSQRVHGRTARLCNGGLSIDHERLGLNQNVIDIYRARFATRLPMLLLLAFIHKSAKLVPFFHVRTGLQRRPNPCTLAGCHGTTRSDPLKLSCEMKQ
ncbi:uncharacterized protein PV09_08037 [Verruconis gallopava]|uniref:Uncharacterized protein n=1 Tax=Verruconis gallopava TaxID=253628 RepID=A0A0D2AMG3_9PEZI|nr:uncharacterized protein PV09_08037 [Verruconis gallopava]KIW00324.1 hypothetical protein PV09_08037 [Verruconis gallopava]